MGTVYRQCIFPFLLSDESQEVIELRSTKAGVETLIKRHEGLIMLGITRYFGYLVDEYAIDELVQAGRIGLWRAIKEYDANRGYSFSTYAMYWIRSKIGRYVTEDKRQKRIWGVSLDYEKGDVALSEMMPNSSSESDIERVEGVELCEYLLMHAGFTVKDRRILLAYFQGETHKTIGMAFGVSHQAIQYRIKRMMKRLRTLGGLHVNGESVSDYTSNVLQRYRKKVLPTG